MLKLGFDIRSFKLKKMNNKICFFRNIISTLHEMERSYFKSTADKVKIIILHIFVSNNKITIIKRG